MISSALASSTALNPPKWASCQQLIKLKTPFASGIPSRATSFPASLFSITPTTHQNRKGLILSCQASTRTLERTVVPPGTIEFSELINETDARSIALKNINDSDISVFKDVRTPDTFISKDVKTSTSRASSRPALSIKEKNPKRLSSSASQISNLDHHLVFRYPVLTEHAMKEIIEHNTLVFVVDKRADKKIIKDAAKKLFKITAKRVNTLNMLDGTKKAYVTLLPEFNAVDVAKKIKIL